MPWIFSKLQLTIDGETVTFSASEIIKIAMEVAQKPATEKVLIPTDGLFDSIMATYGPDADTNPTAAEIIERAMIIPIHLVGMDTPQKWLYIAQYFSKQYKGNPLSGWWANIGKRLIFTQNSQTKDHLFYVSDHGELEEVFEKTRDLVFGEINWLDSDVVDMITTVDAEVERAPLHYKQKFMAQNTHPSLAELLAYHPKLSESERQQLQKDCENPDFLAEQIEQFKESSRYVLNILVAAYNKLKTEHPHEIQKIYRDHGVCDASNNPIRYPDEIQWFFRLELAQDKIRRLIVCFVSSAVNQGKHESLLRPVKAFGGQGEAYRRFYNELTSHLLHQEESEIMQSIRMLLRNELYVAVPDFLPNLIAAWFIAEPARNTTAMLTNLMMLDLIESSSETDTLGVKTYSLLNSLVHPDEVDILPNRRYKNRKGGLLPMCYQGAVNDVETEIKDKIPLNWLRKKESRILIQWMYEFLQRHYPQYHPVKISVDEDTKLPAQEDALMQKISKLEGDIAKEQAKLDARRRDGKPIGLNQKTIDNIEAEKQTIIDSAAYQCKQKASSLIKAAFQKRLLCFSNLLDRSLVIKPYRIEKTKPARSRALPSGLRTIHASPDGNCLFWSISAQTSETQSDLRQLVVAVLTSNPAPFRELIEAEGADVRLTLSDGTEEHIHTLERYIELMSLPGTWGGQIEIAILAQVMQMPIVQISPGYRPIVYPSRINTEGHVYYEGQPIFIYYNGINHYDGLAAVSDDLADEYQIFQTLLLQALNQDPLSNPTHTHFSFFKQLHEAYLIEHRHDDPRLQRDYDRQFGLILR